MYRFLLRVCACLSREDVLLYTLEIIGAQPPPVRGWSYPTKEDINQKYSRLALKTIGT